jgi:hypothetical protein
MATLLLYPIEREKFYFVVKRLLLFLGYSVDEVMGMLFWEVTEDPEDFTGKNFMIKLFLKEFFVEN